MSGGWYLMTRGWMDNPVLADKEYCKRMAWCWLIENAAWEDHVTTWLGKNIEVKRGQVPISLRKLCEAWNWSLGRVQRFLNMLKTNTMIDMQTDTGFCVITICNYNYYQDGYFPADTRADTLTDTAASTATGTNRKNINKLKKENNNPPTPQGGQQDLMPDLPKQPRERSRFPEFWDLFPRKEARKAAEKAYEKARERDSQDNILAGTKAMRRRFDNDPRDKAEKLKFCKYAQGWLNGDRWLDYLDGGIEDDEDDDGQAPPGMTPEEHAKWCAERLGLWRIP